MSNRRSEFLKLRKRGEPVRRNAELADFLQKVATPNESPNVIQSTPQPAREIDLTVNDRDRERAKDAWHREALLARARGDAHIRGDSARDGKLSPPPLPEMPPPLHGAEERIESEETGFQQTAVDLNATFKKKFLSKPLTLEEREANTVARLVAQKFAARTEPASVAPKSEMIQRLDEWIFKQREMEPRRKLEQRLAEFFPAMKQLDIGGRAAALGAGLEQLGEDIVHDAQRHGLEKSQGFVSRWMRHRYDSFQKASTASLMNAFHMLGTSKMLGRGVALASVGLAFVSAISGSDDVREYVQAYLGTGHSTPIASADMLPTFTSETFTDVSMPPEPVPVVDTGGPQKPTILNEGFADTSAEGHFVVAGDAKPNMTDADDLAVHADESVNAPAPYEIKDDRSVWGGLLDVLGEKGVNLSHTSEQQLAQAFHRAVEDTDTESIFIKYGDADMANVDWNHIPDGTKVHFDDIFGNQQFLDRFKEVLESSEYRTLNNEVRSIGGVDGLISDLQDAFGVQYL
jgi:hypothetical protein